MLGRYWIRDKKLDTLLNRFLFASCRPCVFKTILFSKSSCRSLRNSVWNYETKNGHGSLDNGSLQAECFLYLQFVFLSWCVFFSAVNMTGHFKVIPRTQMTHILEDLGPHKMEPVNPQKKTGQMGSKLPFLSLSWRSLNHLKGHLTIPKRSLWISRRSFYSHCLIFHETIPPWLQQKAWRNEAAGYAGRGVDEHVKFIGYFC